MYDLIIGALEKGRIDRAERPHALRRKPGGEGHRMLFGNSDIERAFREGLRELVETRARRHGSGNRADSAVAPGFGDQGVGKHRSIAGRPRRRLCLRPGDDIELLDAMIFVRRRFSRRVAFALLGHDMNEARPFSGIPDIFQNRYQLIEIMAVDRTDIVKAQFLEQGATHRHAARKFIGFAGGIVERAGQFAGEPLGKVAQAQKFAARYQTGEVSGKAADWGGDRHVIVVQDHDQPVSGLARVIHGLIRHARRHGAIADHCYALARLACELAGNGKTQCRADGCRTMGSAERVIFALGPFGEARKAATLAKRSDAVAPTGQHLMRIALVADIPD